MREACRELGIHDPKYTVLEDDLTIKFSAIKRTKQSDSKKAKHQIDVLVDVLGDKILIKLRQNAALNQLELANRLQTSVSSVQRAMKTLKQSGRIVRKDRKRYGFWEIE